MARGDTGDGSGGRTHSIGRRFRTALVGTIAVGGAVFLGGAVSAITGSAHVIPTGGVQVNCAKDEVVVNVTAWAGDVEIVGNGKTTDKAPTLDNTGAGSATFTVDEIGGNGNYTAGRQGHPTDPTPVAFTVNCQAETDVDTTPSAGGPVGTSISDSATLTGGSNPTGSITFKLFGAGDTTCAAAPVYTKVITLTTGQTTAASGSYATTKVGTYSWTADYSGDANNEADSSGCTIETATTTKAAPTISTSQSAGGAVGAILSDTATLAGAYNATGTVSFVLYGPDDANCTGTPVSTTSGAVSSNKASSGNFTSAAAGTYRWIATYSGDANNASAKSGCQDEAVVVTAPGGTGGVQGITTPSTGGTDSLTGMSIGGFLLLGGLGVALAGVLVPRRRRSH